MPDPEVRIDTIGVAFPITGFDKRGCTVSISGYGTADEQYRYRRKLEGGGFLATGIGGMAWVEASIPKRLDPDGQNVEGVTLPDLRRGVREMVEEACEHVSPREGGQMFTANKASGHGSARASHGPRASTHYDKELGSDLMFSVENPKIVRLDLVRDFKLRSAGNLAPLLDGLAGVRRVGRTKVRRFADGDRNLAQTLTVGPKAWKATLYDKCAESDGVAPEGSLRFEARLHAEQLQSVFAKDHGGMVGVVGDLQEAYLQQMRRAWFERAGFDREVVAMDVLWDRVAETDLSARERATFIGWCDAVRRGRGADCGLGVVTERKYRNVAANLGIVLAPAQRDEELIAAHVGLDYDAGCERLLLAA